MGCLCYGLDLGRDTLWTEVDWGDKWTARQKDYILYTRGSGSKPFSRVFSRVF